MVEIWKPAVIISTQWGVVQHRGLREEWFHSSMCGNGEKLVRAC